jgi:methyl-CpG-binding domain protein 4
LRVKLIQEEIAERRRKSWRWQVVVASVMLNRCTGAAVRRVLPAFFEYYPHPLDAAFANPRDMAEVLETLGLQHRRAEKIQALSRQWLCRVPVERMFGVGQYALDSFNIFARGERCAPSGDRQLLRYLRGTRRPK